MSSFVHLLSKETIATLLPKRYGRKNFYFSLGQYESRYCKALF